MSAADFTPVATGTPPPRFGAAEGMVKPVAIPTTVRQIWISDQPTASGAKFALAAAACGIAQVVGTEVADGSGNHQVTITATRRQLVELVRKWAKDGQLLLSPIPPQPEQFLFSGTGEEPVQYCAVFVKTGTEEE